MEKVSSQKNISEKWRLLLFAFSTNLDTVNIIICRKRHVNENCKNNICEISKCRLRRHPKLFKFLTNYGDCKFSHCAFKHEQDLLQIFTKNLKTKVILSMKK